MSVTQEPRTDQIHYLDPATLIENPHNPRTTLGDLSELVDSIRAVGVLEPLVVVPSEVGGHMVMFGHRRRAAAIEADQATVPCLVRPDYADKSPEQVADMLTENLQRQDLSAAEEAEGYAQLAAFDWTPDQIAARTGRKVERVRHGLAATALPKDVRGHVAEGSLTLEQAAALAEFDDDPKALARLLKAAASGYGLHYALADERRKKQIREQKAATKAALTGQGVRIVAKPSQFPWSSVEVEVGKLTDGNGRALTAKTHRKCPGHAAFIDSDGNAVYICQHPKDWGHRTPSHYQHMSAKEVAAAEAAEQAKRVFAENWLVATEARRSFLREYLTKPGKAPTGTLRIAAEILYGFPAHLYNADHQMMVKLLGIEGSDPEPALAELAAKTTDSRLPLLMLAYAAAQAETNLDELNRAWAFSPKFAERWLAIVAGLGYPLTEAEEQIKAECRRQIEEQAAERNEDRWAGVGDDEDQDDTDDAEAGE